MLNSSESDSSPDCVKSIDLAISEGVAREAKRLIFNKYLIDKAVAEHRASMLARDLHDGGNGPMEPLPFLSRVIPFFDEGELQREYSYALVPTENTLGCSWRWRRSDITESERPILSAKLSNRDSLLNRQRDLASYAWVKPLGVFAPMEGKNRADYFREEGLPLIPARVSVYTFPRADRIKIYQIRCHGSIEHWAVLDSRWVQKVQHPSWALPLLSAYGVEIGVRWPEHYSTPKEIQVAMFEWSSGPTSPLGSPNWPHQVVVDLMMLSAQIEHQEKMIKSTVMNLRDVSLDVRFWFALVAGVLIGLLGLSAMPVEWSQSRIAAASLMGMSFGALLTVISEIVVTPRKCAVNQPALPPRLSTHNQHRHRSKLPETFQPDQVPLNGNHAHCIDDDLQ